MSDEYGPTQEKEMELALNEGRQPCCVHCKMPTRWDSADPILQDIWGMEPQTESVHQGHVMRRL